MFKEELRVAREAINLIKRRPDHIKRVISLYAASLLGYRRGLLLRKAYMPVRDVDDLLDGDLKFDGDPLDFVENLQNQIATNEFDQNSNISVLLASALFELESKAKQNDDFRKDFIWAIDTIKFDYHRARLRKVLSKEELTAYYHNAFDPVMNITCGAIDSSVRSADIPEMSTGQGIVQSYRDRKIDWERGIINIPKSVLESANLNNESNFGKVDTNPVIQKWWKDELSNVKLGFEKLLPKLKSLSEPRTYLMCRGLVRSLTKRIDRVIR